MIGLVKITVGPFTFNACHYTAFDEKYNYLHGHTFKVVVSLDAEYSADKGYLIDFEEFRKIAEEVLSGWEYRLIIPEADLGRVRIEGPFKVLLKPIKAKYATAEAICLEILGEIRRRINEGALEVELSEGEGRWVRCSSLGEKH